MSRPRRSGRELEANDRAKRRVEVRAGPFASSNARQAPGAQRTEPGIAPTLVARRSTTSVYKLAVRGSTHSPRATIRARVLSHVQSSGVRIIDLTVVP